MNLNMLREVCWRTTSEQLLILKRSHTEAKSKIYNCLNSEGYTDWSWYQTLWMVKATRTVSCSYLVKFSYAFVLNVFYIIKYLLNLYIMLIYKLGEIVRYICDVMSNNDLCLVFRSWIIGKSGLNWKSILILKSELKISELKLSELKISEDLKTFR